MPSLADLEMAFYGAGAGQSVSSAKYQQLLALYEQGITLEELVSGDVAFAATELYSLAAMSTASSFPRLLLPTAMTTSVFAGGYNFPNWYSAVDLHIGWSNEGAGSGNVVFAWNVRQVNVGATPGSGVLISTGFGAFVAPAANATTVTVLDPLITFEPASLGFILGLEVARVGGGSDTLLNSVGIEAVGHKKVTPP